MQIFYDYSLSLTIYIYIYYIYSEICIVVRYVFTTDHWRILYSSYRKLAWVGFDPINTELRSNALTNYWAISHKLNSHSEPTLYSYSHFTRSSMSNFISAIAFVTCHIYFNHFSRGNHASVAEWTDRYGIHYRKILWSSYRRLAWVGFQRTTTEFRLDALTDWAIRPWVQLALISNFVQLL